MKAFLVLAFMFVTCLLLSACLTPAETQTSFEVLDTLLRQKVITMEQYQQLVEVLQTGGTTWLRDLGVLLGGSLGGALVTRLQRGAPQRRVKGSPVTVV